MAIIIIGVIWNELIGKRRFCPRGIFMVTGRIALMPDMINKTRTAIALVVIEASRARQQIVLNIWINVVSEVWQCDVPGFRISEIPTSTTEYQIPALVLEVSFVQNSRVKNYWQIAL